MTEYCTIDGFENLSKQEMFDMAASHILKTGVKSTNMGMCLYGGTGCAASVFLKPEARGEMDRAGDSGWGSLSRIEACGIPQYKVDFVCQLQQCHDDTFDADFLQGYVRRMMALAEEHNLSVEVFNKKETNAPNSTA